MAADPSYTQLHPSFINALIVITVFHCLSFNFYYADTKHVEGVLNTSQNWAFLSRFCFLSKTGFYRYKLEYPTEYKIQNLLLYYDEPHQWKAIYHTGKTCLEKESVLNKEAYQRIILTETFEKAKCSLDKVNRKYLICKTRWRFNSARERWWYMAISNCNSSKGLYLKYDIVMLNSKNEDDHWFAHFSADEFYILHIDLVFFILNVILLCASLAVSYCLRMRGLFHRTFKIYLVTLVCQCFGVMFLFISYNEYAKDGIGVPNLKILGQLFVSLSSLLFITLILLLAKGYTVTRARLSRRSTVRLTTFIILYSLSYAILFIYQAEVFDPGDVLYIYDSPGGYGLLILRIIGWAMLLYAVFFSLKHHPQKMTFYVPFFIFYSLWFLAGPILIIIFNFVIDKWVRETVANGIELSVTFLGHVYFLFLTIPTSNNKNFPFHIRTTQIQALQQLHVIDGGPLTLDNFSRHPYEAPAIKRSNSLKEVKEQNNKILGTGNETEERRVSFSLSRPIVLPLHGRLQSAVRRPSTMVIALPEPASR